MVERCGEPVGQVRVRTPRRASPPMVCSAGARERACVNTRRIIPRALVAVASLLVLGVATTADAPSPAQASSVSATSAHWPSPGGVTAESPTSPRAPAARYELHF